MLRFTHAPCGHLFFRFGKRIPRILLFFSRPNVPVGTSIPFWAGLSVGWCAPV